MAQYPTGPSAEQELASLRHDAEMERMRSEHTLEMEKLRNEMRMLRTAGPAMGQGQPMGNAWMAPGPGIQQAGGALSALSSRLVALESNYTQREAELNSLGAIFVAECLLFELSSCCSPIAKGLGHGFR